MHLVITPESAWPIRHRRSGATKSTREYPGKQTNFARVRLKRTRKLANAKRGVRRHGATARTIVRFGLTHGPH